MPSQAPSVFGGKSVRSLYSQASSSKHGVQRVTEDLVPISKFKRALSYDMQQPDVDASVDRERLELRVNLLSSFPPHGPPFKKSWVRVGSYSGSIRVEIVRLSGSENHFFQLAINAEKADVTVVLPESFRGLVSVHDQQDRRARLSCASAVRARVEDGFVRLNGAPADEFEDEVYVRTSGRVNLKLMSAEGKAVDSGGVDALRRLLRL